MYYSYTNSGPMSNRPPLEKKRNSPSLTNLYARIKDVEVTESISAWLANKVDHHNAIYRPLPPQYFNIGWACEPRSFEPSWFISTVVMFFPFLPPVIFFLSFSRICILRLGKLLICWYRNLDRGFCTVVDLEPSYHLSFRYTFH